MTVRARAWRNCTLAEVNLMNNTSKEEEEPGHATVNAVDNRKGGQQGPKRAKLDQGSWTTTLALLPPSVACATTTRLGSKAWTSRGGSCPLATQGFLNVRGQGARKDEPWAPIVFYSKILNPAQCKYSTYD